MSVRARELPIRLPSYVKAGQLAGDIAGQFLIEADARRHGMLVEREYVDGWLRYHFGVDLVGRNEHRLIRVGFIEAGKNPVVHIDGPQCLRHRWEDDSLCMWDPSSSASERWIVGDGLPRLAQHVQVHAHCEAECRAGNPWPKEEMAGAHPRKKHCPSCRGQGR